MTTVDLAVAQQELQALTDEAAHGHDVPSGRYIIVTPLIAC